MQLIKPICLYLLIILLFLSCKTDKNVINIQQSSDIANSSINGCVISGTIISIDNNLELSDSLSPCSKVPCIAKVKINQVLERGSGITTTIEDGMEINVHFVFTLSPTTDKLFPNIQKHYTGLNVNDKFKANIQQRIQLNNDSMLWYVYDYIKL